MSSAPVTPAVPATPAPTPAGTWFDTTHLVLLGLLLAAILTAVYLFDSKRVADANTKVIQAQTVAAEAQQAAEASAKSNSAFQAQVTAQLSQLAKERDALLQSNMTIAAALANSKNALAQQQAQIAKAPPTDVAQTWQKLVGTGSVEVTSAGYMVDPAAGVATVQQLQAIPVLNKEVNSLTLELSNDGTIIKNDQTALTTEQNAHASDNANNAKTVVALQDKVTVAQDQVKAAKAANAKSKLKWFAGGAVTALLLIFGHAL